MYPRLHNWRWSLSQPQRCRYESSSSKPFPTMLGQLSLDCNKSFMLTINLPNATLFLYPGLGSAVKPSIKEILFVLQWEQTLYCYPMEKCRELHDTSLKCTTQHAKLLYSKFFFFFFERSLFKDLINQLRCISEVPLILLSHQSPIFSSSSTWIDAQLRNHIHQLHL